MSDESKVRLLFRKLQHTGLRRYSQTTGTTILYTMAAKTFSTASSELPEYIAKNARNVSGFQVGHGAKGGNGVYNEDG